MSENRHVAFDTDLCRANPEAAADEIARLERHVAQLFRDIRESDEKRCEITDDLMKAIRQRDLAETKRADTERMYEARIQELEAEQVLANRAHKTMTAEIEKFQRNLRHWREECGKLHAKLSKAHADLAAWEITAKRCDEAEAAKCSDCPPPGYPTDVTRCTECPERYHP